MPLSLNVSNKEENENIPPAPASEPDSLEPSSNISPTHSRLNGKCPDRLSTPAEEIGHDQTVAKKISILVYLGLPESFNKYAEELYQSKNEFIIAFTYISDKTTLQDLEYLVSETFKNCLARIDPDMSLDLNTDSITSCHLGEAKFGANVGYPELSPYRYIIGNVRSLYICLQNVASLSFGILIPSSIVQRCIKFLTDHRRLILYGPYGTCKSYFARKLAEFYVSQSQHENPNEAILHFE